MRYEADDTEEFLIDLPNINVYIGDTKSLIRYILDDNALLNELSETIAGPIQEKHLIAEGLAFTLVPQVYDLPRTKADLFIMALGPQPIPPGREVLATHIGLTFKPLTTPTEKAPRPPPWWWWIGLPPMEFLQWLDRMRLSDIPISEQTGSPVRESAEFAHRIMADKALVMELSAKITRLFSKHGLVMKAGKTYVFTPLVFDRPAFADALFCPQVVDSATRPAHGIQGWVNPIDGVMPPYLQKVVHPGA